MVQCQNCVHFEEWGADEDYECWCKLKEDRWEDDPLLDGDLYYNEEHDCEEFEEQ